MRWRAAAAVLALLLLLVAPPVEAPFQTNVRVSAANPTGLRANPQIAAGTGAISVVWQQANALNGHDVIVSKSADGGTWTTPIQVDDTADSTIANFPDVAASGTRVYTVWQDSRGGPDGDDIYFDWSEGGSSWSADRRISDDVGGPRQLRPSVAVAPNGSLYVAYSVAGVFDDSTMIRLVASHDGGQTWTASVAVNASAPNHRGDPRVAVAPNGTVHVVWRDGRAGTYTGSGGLPLEDYDVYLASSSDGGRAFGTNVLVNTPVANRRQTSPDLVIGNGTLYVAWEDERFNSFELFDVFVARSTDGRTFLGETAANGTSPVVAAPKRTTHLAPSLAWSAGTGQLFVAWMDDQGDRAGTGNHNIYVAVSSNGGATWAPFHRGPNDAPYFFDDGGTYNGLYDPAEATIASADDRLDPGPLDSGTDWILSPGKASVAVDLTGTRLGYADLDSSGSYTGGDPIVRDAPTLLFPQIEAGAFLPATDLVAPDRTLSLLRNPDSDDTTDLAIDLAPNRTLALGSWTTDAAVSFDLRVIGLQATDPIASASLTVRYRVPAGYSGTAGLNASVGGGPNVTLLVPASTNDVYVTAAVDLVALGFDTVPELRFLNATFTNGGEANVTFDQMTFNATRGAPGAYDAEDTVAVGSAPPVGSPLTAFSASDRIAFLDSDLDGAYDAAEPVLLAPASVASGMSLTADFEVLAPTSGRWTAFLNPFPVNDDSGTGQQRVPSLAVSDSGHLVAVWQDYRNSPANPWPDIQSARAVVFAPPPDAEPPVIAFTPPTRNFLAGESFNLTVTVTDNVGVTEVLVFVQAPKQVSATSFVMRRVPETDTWYYPYDLGREPGLLSYHFEARDASGNVAREPPAANGQRQIFIVNPSRDFLGAVILVAAFLLVFLPVLYLLRRARRREKADASKEPEARDGDPGMR